MNQYLLTSEWEHFMPADSIQLTGKQASEASLISNDENQFPNLGIHESEHAVPQSTLREICWITGTRFPKALTQDGIAVVAVNPHLLFIQWHINDATLLSKCGYGPDHEVKVIVRMYSIQSGEGEKEQKNHLFDIDVNGTSGSYYLKTDPLQCTIIAAIGLGLPDDRFVPCSSSNMLCFERPRNYSRCNTSGLYVSQGFTRVFPVKNALCGPLFDRMNHSLKVSGKTSLSVAIVLNESAVAIHDTNCPTEERPITQFLQMVLPKCEMMRASPQLFAPESRNSKQWKKGGIIEKAKIISKRAVTFFKQAHKENPFDCIQCHDWYSAPAAIEIGLKYNLPVTCVFHSVEPERSGVPSCPSPLSQQIVSWERELMAIATTILVARESTKESIVGTYGIPPEDISVVADSVASVPDLTNEIEGNRHRFGLSNREPVFLFAGEMAPHTGADLFIDALPNVCHDFPHGQFAIVGEGYLKSEFEYRVWNAGIGHRCRFFGDMPSESFRKLLIACDAVVIPARTRQERGLANLASNAGIPVLATHQSGLDGIQHGVNGLLMYDNTGSISWGLKEVLAHPIRMLPRSLLDEPQFLHTAECIAAMYITHWASSVALQKGVHV
jgi:glycosyltransferase involved in cell wall biosynthesis